MLSGVRGACVAAVLCWLANVVPACAGPALLYDVSTGRVVYAEDADQPWFPASLAKLMTAYLVFDTWKSGKAERTGPITISAKANGRPRMRLGLGVGKVITYEEAMAALIIHSANDIAVAIAEAVAGSEAAFVEEMNATAARLKMTTTRFINANGLPGEGQHSTARDLAILTQAILREFPEHAGLFAAMSAPVGKRMLATHNPVLLRVLGGDGMKTGFTCSAGYNIVASVTRDGARLVAIVLGEQTPAKREARTAALIEHGFRMLDWKTALSAPTLETLPVEPFDAELVRAANLTKRFKDCQPPEPQLDADGNPVCPEVTDERAAKSVRAIQAIRKMKAMKVSKGAKAKPDPCAPPVVAKLKPPPQRAVKVVAKRGGSSASVSESGGTSVFGSALP